MPYRLYRRDPILKGSWYLAVTCKGCGRPIYLVDASKEASTSIVGNNAVSAPCLRCTHDDMYSADELRILQAVESLDGARPSRASVSASPRKPLWKSYPDAKATFGVGFIEDRPACAAIVGRIVTSWADIEVECSRLLGELMEAKDYPAAASLFASLRSSRAQHDALRAVADVALTADDLELFSAHMARRTSLEKERNDLVHGMFGVSVAISEHVVWVSTLDYVLFSANKLDLEEFKKKQFVYENGTLERIAQEICEFHEQLGFFIGYLRARRNGQRGAEFRSRRYTELCDQPHIKQALARIRVAKKDRPA